MKLSGPVSLALFHSPNFGSTQLSLRAATFSVPPIAHPHDLSFPSSNRASAPVFLPDDLADYELLFTALDSPRRVLQTAAPLT